MQALFGNNKKSWNEDLQSWTQTTASLVCVKKKKKSEKLLHFKLFSRNLTNYPQSQSWHHGKKVCVARLNFPVVQFVLVTVVNLVWNRKQKREALRQSNHFLQDESFWILLRGKRWIYSRLHTSQMAVRRTATARLMLHFYFTQVNDALTLHWFALKMHTQGLTTGFLH